MAEKKPGRIKKVTEIPEAKVTIEVEENEDSAKDEEKSQDLPEAGKLQEEQENSGENEKTENDSSSSNTLSWKKVIFIIVFVVPVGLLMFGGFLFFSKDFNSDFLGRKAPEKSIKLPEKSPTPKEVQINKQAHEILVLNGSGIAGEAASVQELLEGEGFSVSSIGNADSSDYTTTEISATDDIDKEFLDELKEALETRGPAKVVEAPEDQTDDIIVIVGNLLADPTPTPILE